MLTISAISTTHENQYFRTDYFASVSQIFTLAGCRMCNAMCLRVAALHMASRRRQIRILLRNELAPTTIEVRSRR